MNLKLMPWLLGQCQHSLQQPEFCFSPFPGCVFTLSQRLYALLWGAGLEQRRLKPPQMQMQGGGKFGRKREGNGAAEVWNSCSGFNLK